MAHPYQRLRLEITNHRAFTYFGLRTGALLALTLLCYGCARHEASMTAVPGSPAPQRTPRTAQQQSPTVVEVNEAVMRVFKTAALIDQKQQPAFLAGDFNGDASQDIAVIVQPVGGKLAEMNQDLPPWILKDPLAGANRPAPLRITSNEILLAIIHGYGPHGWRDAQATQTYLLKNAVGLELKACRKNDFLSANQGQKLPRLVGDLISENLGGKAGYLYFTGAQYSWYDPKTFRGEPETRLTHPGMTVKKKFDLLHPNLVAAEK